jgi:uncharacterized protein (DUF927 family)
MNSITPSTAAGPNVSGAIASCIIAGVPKGLLVPLLPPNVAFNGKGHGKMPAAFNPATGQWEGLDNWSRGGHDPSTILLNADTAGGNAGLLMGAPAGEFQFLAVDIDLLDAPKAVKWRNGILAVVQELWGQTLLVRETVPHRAMILVRLPPDADPGSKRVFHLSYADPAVDGAPEPIGKIELLANGQQAAVAGTHPSGNKMLWFHQGTGGPGNETFDAPPVLDGMPVFASFDDLVLAILRVLDAMAGEGKGFSYTSHALTSRSGTAPALIDLAAPSAAELAGLLDQTPNPATADRDIYCDFALAVAGARAGLKAARGALSQPEEDLIADSFARWASRWTAPKGHIAGTFEEERAKFVSDWSQPRDENYAGWRHVMVKAMGFGAPESTILDISMLDAQEQFRADIMPAGAAMNGAAATHLSPREIATFAMEGQPFRLRPAGWVKSVPVIEKKGKPPTEFIEVKLCSPFVVMGRAENADGGDGALLIGWEAGGAARTLLVPLETVHGGGTAITKHLSPQGIEFEAVDGVDKDMRRLLSAFHSYKGLPRVRSASSAGWQGGMNSGKLVFLLPSGEAIGADTTQGVILRQGNAIARDTSETWGVSGTLESWQTEVARYAPGNDRIVLYMSAGFAPAIMRHTGDKSGGLHLLGPSSTGKTAAMACSVSAYGSAESGRQIKQWRATTNGLEATAASMSDCLLALDEMGQADGDQVSDVLYSLANETGKLSMTRDRNLRPPSSWRVLILSTGEVTAAQKIAESGKGHAAHAGLDVRLVNIKADAGAGMGVFQELHGWPSSGALVKHLERAAETHYGAAGRAFLHRLTSELNTSGDALLAWIALRRKEFCGACMMLPGVAADGQVLRVLDRFALVAAAGELAVSWGILPWPAGEAERAARALFFGWVDERGGTGSREDTDALQAVRLYLEKHGMTNRFPELNGGRAILAEGQEVALPDTKGTFVQAGYRFYDEHQALWFLLSKEVFRQEICRGKNPTDVAKAIHKPGLLQKGNGRNWTRQKKIPGLGAVEFYWVSAAILGG